MASSVTPEILVMMGVSGSGKTTVGTLLAKRMGAIFADADDYHSPENKAKMAGGTPLTDEDRAPWLESLNRLLRGWAEADSKGVLACSALKASYRETLGEGLAEGKLAYVWLDGSPEMIAARLRARKGTYMNPALLGSQIATLEVPEGALRITVDKTPDQIVDDIVRHFGLSV